MAATGADDGASSDFFADRAPTAFASSSDDTTVGDLTFFTAVVADDDDDGAWSEPDDFLSAVGFATGVVAPSVFSSVAVSLWLCRGCVDDDSAVLDVALEADGVVPLVVDGVVPLVVALVVEPVEPVEPDEVEAVLDVVDESVAGAAHATPGDREIADPMPNATANAPIRPT